MVFEEYSNTIELLFLLVGGFGLLQKIAAMERYHHVRVVVLTTVLSVVAILLYDKCFSLATGVVSDCSF